MLILIPYMGKYLDFEVRLDAALFQQIVSELRFTNTRVFNMPRFKFESEIDLLDILSVLGLNAPFSDKADFSGMSSDGGLFIASTQHKATISVDEMGTESSGATIAAIPISLMSSPCDNPLIADRPFIFAIYHQETGAILFLGRVLNPAG